MIEVSAKTAANDFDALLDKVEHGETVVIRKDGRVRAEIRRRRYATKAEFLEMLKKINFSEAESQELKAAMKAANDVFGYAGGH